MFAPKKAVLTEQKVAALKEKNDKEYMKLAHVLRLEYQKCLLIITKKACEEINLRPNTFQLTMKQYLEDPDKKDEIDEMEKKVRQSVEGKKVTQSDFEILEASKFENRLQRELTRKLDALALIM